MGDPRKIRSKFVGPSHPWQKERIEQEKLLVKEYGLRNKHEIWKHSSRLKIYAQQAKRLVALRRLPQAEKEKVQLLTKLNSMGLLSKEAVLEDVLGLTVKDILELRLQTQVCRKGFAKTMKQARQFIVHGHITVAGKKVTAPSYVVSCDEIPTISFVAVSALSNAEHPERKAEKTKVAIEKEARAKERMQRQGARGRGRSRGRQETRKAPRQDAKPKEKAAEKQQEKK